MPECSKTLGDMLIPLPPAALATRSRPMQALPKVIDRRADPRGVGTSVVSGYCASLLGHLCHLARMRSVIL